MPARREPPQPKCWRCQDWTTVRPYGSAPDADYEPCPECQPPQNPGTSPASRRA